MAEVGEHYRSTDDADDVGVYRVVGVTDDVALLRVTDADGRRAYTGEIRRVPPRVLDAEFDPADDPDARFTPVANLRNTLSGLYWNVRKFL